MQRASLNFILFGQLVKRILTVHTYCIYNKYMIILKSRPIIRVSISKNEKQIDTTFKKKKLHL